MTQEEKRIKIAKAMGWKAPFGWGNYPEREGGTSQGFVGTDPDGDIDVVPDYFRSLDDCRTFEETDEEHIPVLVSFNMPTHVRYIAEMVGAEIDDMPDTGDFYLVLNATAAQRAEAFGLTLGLWKEGE